MTSGGISVGKYDYVLESMKKAGVNLKFWKVNIKPGMPMAFGTYANNGRNVLVFCLPGNPVSSVVTFLEFVRPCVEKMMSRHNNTARVHLTQSWNTHCRRRTASDITNVELYEANKGNSSCDRRGIRVPGCLRRLVNANCLIILNEQQIRV